MSIQQAFQLHNQGQLEAAATLYLALIKQQPKHFDAQQLLGLLRSQQGRYGDALTHLRKALTLNPKDAPTLLNLSSTYAKMGNHRDALSAVDQALQINPTFAKALINRGNALRNLERYDDALATFDRVLHLQPDQPEGLNGRASVLLDMFQPEAALPLLDRAVAKQAQFPEAMNNCGIAFQQLRRFSDAEACFRQALQMRPDYPSAFCNFGQMLAHLDRQDEALAAFDSVLKTVPDHIEALNHRGTLHNTASRYQEAIADFAKVLEIKPNLDLVLSGQLMAQLNLCEWAAVDRGKARLVKQIRDRSAMTAPLLAVACGATAADQRLSAAYFVDKDCRKLQQAPASAARPKPVTTPPRRIRLGYLSTDFGVHAVGYQIAELGELHDKARFEVTGISIGAPDSSALRTRITRQFEHNIDGWQMTDKDIAAEIAARDIDILVDLNGHTRGGRWGITMQRPAPVQVTYLGFPGTTGSTFFDYVIADPVIAPFNQQPHFSEQIVQLPHTYMINDRQLEIAPATPTRGDLGLPEHGVVFCCFNTSYKITPAVFDVWMRLLTQVNGSVLWLRRFHDVTVANLRREASARGVQPERIVFADRAEMPEHLARHRMADLFLDTLPFNGHSTACAALWAGLPVLTCLGESFAGRVGASLLQAIGMPDLIAPTLADYEIKALQLARDPAAMAAVKQRLAGNRLTTPLFDTPRFVRDLERAYITMWDTYVAGAPPRSFAVPAL
jgi:protein O-GlcNAc transferase